MRSDDFRIARDLPKVAGLIGMIRCISGSKFDAVALLPSVGLFPWHFYSRLT